MNNYICLVISGHVLESIVPRSTSILYAICAYLPAEKASFDNTSTMHGGRGSSARRRVFTRVSKNTQNKVLFRT